MPGERVRDVPGRGPRVRTIRADEPPRITIFGTDYCFIVILAFEELLSLQPLMIQLFAARVVDDRSEWSNWNNRRNGDNRDRRRPAHWQSLAQLPGKRQRPTEHCTQGQEKRRRVAASLYDSPKKATRRRAAMPRISNVENVMLPTPSTSATSSASEMSSC